MSHPDQKDKNEEDAKRYLQRVGLEDFQQSYPHQLSGGMKQRVAIIRSLLNHTPVQLMDEPFSAVDMQTRHTLQEQLIGVWKRFDTTIVFVTHDVDEAVFLADKVVVMEKNPGRVKEVVPINLERPRKRESAEFLKIQEEVMEALGVEDMEG
jgi:NitT/TauT family transport system ATP-binding protein